MGKPVFRFAPSPNGELHLGHALSALTGLEMARRLGGRFLLRIEDIDLARARPEHVEAILEDLAWLGLTWEEPVLRQSEHFPVYREAAARLDRLGLVYPCFMTRAELAAALSARPQAADPDGAPRIARHETGLAPQEAAARMASGQPFALRLDMTRALAVLRDRPGGGELSFAEIDADGTTRRIAARPARWGDAVIVRKDVPASYHLAVVVDDARQGVTHVTRGLDLYAATDLHRLLQLLLGLPEPVYHHHRLITDASGRKLSKSARDTSLRALRATGATPREIRRLTGFG
ncbi:MAG: tRNA glutamyl-Q(34) synthetase GluQRS [Hyphomicrobiaceae bacterium]|nr:tRNA glutamyl-Q(34) synthetase GluQRS [Hyphomicrobiaceae bacterium]